MSFDPNRRRDITEVSSGSSITNSESEDSEGELGNNTVEMTGPPPTANELLQLITAQQQSIQQLYLNQEQFRHIIDGTQQGMNAALREAQFVIQAPQNPNGGIKPPHITSTTFPKLELNLKEDNLNKFYAWETLVRNQIRANRSYQHPVVAFPTIAAGILLSFRGSAENLAVDINPDTFADIDAMMNSLRNMVCGGAVAERAMVLFMASKQKPTEDITAYANKIENIWLRAYPNVADRSVQVLIKQFLAGLADQEISDTIIRREAGVPNVFRDLRNLAITTASKAEIIKQNRIQHQNLKSKGSAGGVGPRDLQLQGPKQAPVEAMEIGAVGVRKKPYVAPKGDRVAAETKKNEPKGIVVGRSAGYTPPVKPNNPPNNAVGKEGPCFRCRGPHRVQNCPKPDNRNKIVAAIQETIVEDDDEDFPQPLEDPIASLGYLYTQKSSN